MFSSVHVSSLHFWQTAVVEKRWWIQTLPRIYHNCRKLEWIWVNFRKDVSEQPQPQKPIKQGLFKAKQKGLPNLANPMWWEEVDSNHRSQWRQIYSLFPLAARESSHISCGLCSWWAFGDSNPGPAGYEPDALTNWAKGPLPHYTCFSQSAWLV